MSVNRLKLLHYRQAHFATPLPVDYLYGQSHAWIAREDKHHWRGGLTRFATRMLGEMVEHGFGVEIGAPVRPEQVIGWVEGFKAVSDLISIAQGKFAGGNPALQENIMLVNKDPHGAGWLYRIKGRPDSKCLDVHGYCAVLDQTIRKLQTQREAAIASGELCQ